MTQLLLTLALALAPSDGVEEGYISAYDYNPTVGTINYRLDEGSIPAWYSLYDGVVAVQDCDRVGQSALLYVGDERFNVLVFDCAGIEDGGYAWMEDNNVLAEVGYFLRQASPHIVHSHARLVYKEVNYETDTRAIGGDSRHPGANHYNRGENAIPSCVRGVPWSSQGDRFRYCA